MEWQDLEVLLIESDNKDSHENSTVIIENDDMFVELTASTDNYALKRMMSQLYSDSDQYSENTSDHNLIGKWKTNARYNMSELPAVPVFGYKQVKIGAPVTMLAEQYTDMRSFMSAFEEVIWVTYRYGFEPIVYKDQIFTSDTGWGCTIRAGQMLFVNTLKRHFQTTSCIEILELIQENLPAAPFSLQKIVEYAKTVDKNPGEWYSPCLISHVLKALTLSFKIPNMKVYVFMDSVIPISAISRSESFLMLIPLMLGIGHIQPEYYEAIKFFLSMKYSVGVIGGIPKSALYLIGYQEDHLLFLDPHLVQQACSSGQDMINKLSTYHCKSAKLLPFDMAESSLSLGFYFRKPEEFKDFVQLVEENDEVLHGVIRFKEQNCSEDSRSSSENEDFYIV